MSHIVQLRDPFSDLEALQDDLLARLDELDSRLARVLAEFGAPAAAPSSLAAVQMPGLVDRPQ